MKKALFFVLILVVFILFSAASTINAAKPSDFGLKEGDFISAIFSDDPDVYIINENGYKRLFLNPEIFKFYGHLGGFVNVKLVTPEVRDAFITSGLFRNCEDNDQKVYGVDIEGEDSGELHWVNVPGNIAASEDPDFFKKIFCINRKEFKWYPTGTEFKAVREVPKYERIEPQGIAREITSEQGNIKEVGKVVICHHSAEAPNKFLEITIDASALKAHLEHGDSVGVCPSTPQPSQPIYVTPTPTATNPIVVTVLSPNGGEVWEIGKTYNITWSSAGVSTVDIEVAFFDSQKNHIEGVVIAFKVDAEKKSYSWTIPTDWAFNYPYYKVEILDSQNRTSIRDWSDNYFSIVAAGTPSITVLSPNGGEKLIKGSTHTIKWSASNNTWIYIDLLKGSSKYIGIAGPADQPLPQGYYNWTIPTFLPDGDDYIIRISDNTGVVSDTSNAAFSIVMTATQTPVPTVTPISSPLPTANPLRITSPNGGEQWTIGPKYTIQWENPGSISGIYVDLYKGGVYLAGLGGLGYSYGGGPTSWTWNTIDTPNFIPGSDFKIRVRSDSDPKIYDESDNYFSISVSLPSPTTCDYLKSNSATSPYFDQCSSGGYNNVCFNKYYSTFQGCNKNTSNECTVNNANASQNILCPVSNISTPTPTPITQSYFSRNLTMGSTGNDVKQLQALLVNEVGYSADLLTGYFGRITRDAVKRFQEKYGVRPVSGYFGEITRKALSALISH